MPPPSLPEGTDLPDHIKRLGAPQVRLMLSVGQIAPQLHRSAIRWLAEQDQEKESFDDDFRRSQLREARAAKIAAIVAAIAAIAAVTISATSKIAAMLR